MDTQLRGARQAYRSSEGSGIPPRSPSRADREAAHRSAPAAPSYSRPQPASLDPGVSQLRDRSLAADVPDNYRDSFVSIVDDPFFLRFDVHSSGNESLGFEPPPPEHDDRPSRDDEDPDLRWPPPRRESLTIGHPSHSVRRSTATVFHHAAPAGADARHPPQTATDADMESLNIACVEPIRVAHLASVLHVA